MPIVKWEGVYPAILTPFDKNDSIDFNMFRINALAQVEAGVDAIVLGGSLGEASTLQDLEKIDLLAYTKDLLKDKVPVVMTVAEQSTKAAIKAAKAAEENGADGLMILPPMRYKADDAETVNFFTRISKNTSLPIMIYNNPVDYKILVSPDMFEALADCPNINAVKESTRDTTNITRMINRFGDRFKLLTGVDTLALESIFIGADGWVAGLVNAFPKETVAIFRLAKAGYHSDAIKLYRWFMPLLELDINSKLVQYIKLAAEATNIGSEEVRSPRLVLRGEERNQVLNIISRALENRPELPDYMNLQTLEYA